MLSSESDKAKLFDEHFSSPKMVREVVMNLDLSKASGPDCIPVVVLKHCVLELS